LVSGTFGFNQSILIGDMEMKASILFALTVAVALTALPTLAAEERARPVGVEAKNWLPISDRFGFVIVTEKEWPPNVGGSREVLLADPERVSAHLQAPKKGYFVIKTEAGWQRVLVSEPSELGS
jgi:hypothetical protein